MDPTPAPRGAAEPRPFPLGSGFETTYLPHHDVDCAQTSGHHDEVHADLDSVLAHRPGVLRYPVRWHRVEREPGRFDWAATDDVMLRLRDAGVDVVVDLLHHTSHPRWTSFADKGFGDAYRRWAEAVLARYPWMTSYTLVNEPLVTLLLAGHEGLWPPYLRGVDGFARLLTHVLPALCDTAALYRAQVPRARHVWVDAAEAHRGERGGPAEHARRCDDRRFSVLDLVLQHRLDDDDRPFLRDLIAAAPSLAELRGLRVDILGLDYYPQSEWWYDEHRGHAPSPYPRGLAALLAEYADRYRLPVMVTETNVRGAPSDRASWLRYVLEQAERAERRGVDVRGVCWFPWVDGTDWDSLLARAAGRPDPVGIVGRDDDGGLVETSATRSWRLAAGGARAAQLPAYRFQEPAASRLAGFLPAMAHWPWVDPPADELVAPLHVPLALHAADAPPRHQEDPVDSSTTPTTTVAPEGPEASLAAADLVVLSHLRWGWVWQRPQHLVSRFARTRAAHGGRTFFVEEPVEADVDHPTLQVRQVDSDGVHRVWLEIPEGSRSGHLTFESPGTEDYSRMLADFMATRARPVDVLLWTPMALEMAVALRPRVLHYDVMDDLASFAGAPEGLRLLGRRAVEEADLVTAGGRSLQRLVAGRSGRTVHLFPSGVDAAHFHQARALRPERARPVAGYVGVVDERVDLGLVADLADALPDWDVRVVGPVAKIDPRTIPERDNLFLEGMVEYRDLPRVLAGFDVALMPFALNEATRAISPTKTLEYLAAGLPVVSTRVPDVVADHSHVVHLADDAAGFADACRLVLQQDCDQRDRAAASLQAQHEWDSIASAMEGLVLDVVVDDLVVDLRQPAALRPGSGVSA